MPINLVDFIEHELSGGVGQKIAATIGATPQATATGVQAAVAATIGGLWRNVVSARSAADLLNLLVSSNHDARLGNLTDAPAPRR